MIDEIPSFINKALDEFFGEYFEATSPFFQKLRVIAEPGRYFAEASMHLACHVHSVRNRPETCDYLISDGLYGMLYSTYPRFASADRNSPNFILSL